MNKVEYVSGSASLLNRIRDLWLELNDHHITVSAHFSDNLSKSSFDARKESLAKSSTEENLLVEIAIDAQSKTDIAYCITSIKSDNKGEIESIYVKPQYRRSGIGTSLMSRAIDWLDSKNVAQKTVGVVCGNEQAFDFYSQFGFYPRATILTQKANTL